MKIAGLLLFAYGAIVAILWLTFAGMAIAVGGMAGADFTSVEFAVGYVAPFVTFCSYPWIVRHSYKRQTLLIWGVIAHLPLLYWLSHANDHPGILVLSGILLLGLLLFGLYSWLVWTDTDDSRPAQSGIDKS